MSSVTEFKQFAWRTTSKPKSFITKKSLLSQQSETASKTFRILTTRRDMQTVVTEQAQVQTTAQPQLRLMQTPKWGLHNDVMRSIELMPAEIKNFINLQHYSSEFQTHTAANLSQLEYEIIHTAEQIDKEILVNIFKDGNHNAYNKFRPQQIVDMILLVNDTISTAIKYLSINYSNVGIALSQIWKYMILLLDLQMQWNQDRDNNYIQERVNKLQKKLDQSRAEVKQLENKIMQLVKQHELDIQQEKLKQYQLQAEYDQVRSHELDLERLINEDVKAIAEGGSSSLRKNIKELEITLQTLDKQINYQSGQIVTRLTSVAEVAKSKEKGINEFRQYLGMNNQQVGDVVISNIFSEHPWMQLLEMRNIYPNFIGTEYTSESESKLDILHSILMIEPSNVSACKQFMDLYITDFEQMYKHIQTLLMPYEEPNQVAVNLQQLCGVIFNIAGYEALELQQLNQIKKIYQLIVNTLRQYNQKSINGTQLPEKLYEDEYFLKRILKMNVNSPRQLLLLPINKSFSELLFGVLPNYTIIEQIFESRREVPIVALLHHVAMELSKQAKLTFQERLSDYVVPSQINTIGQSIAKSIFPEYKLDCNLLQNYVISRYCYVKEKSIKLNNECFFRIEGKSTESIPPIDDKPIIECIHRIRQILLFNPQILIEQKAVSSVTQARSPKKQMTLI